MFSVLFAAVQFPPEFFTPTIHPIRTSETTNVSIFQEIRIFIFGEGGDRFSIFRRIPSRKDARETARFISLRQFPRAVTFYDSRTPVSPQPLLKRLPLSLSLFLVHFSREHLGHLARAIKNERLSRGVEGLARMSGP